VLNDPELNALWRAEVDAMRTRISEMRQALVDVLKDALPTRLYLPADPARMFSYTGFSADRWINCAKPLGLPDCQRPCLRGGP
jgi:aromatic-amino-acid transaminase